MNLVKYDNMCTAIQACYAVDEVKDIRDKAAALEAYARQAQNTDAERKACEIRLRAERKVGKLLAEKERKQQSGLKRGPLVHDEPTESEYQQAKQSAGISDTQAKRWQKLASIPDETFEDAMRSPVKPSTSGLVKKANGKETQMNPKALWLWGRIRDFEREDISYESPAELYGEMTKAMHSDLHRIIPGMIDFLTELLEVENG